MKIRGRGRFGRSFFYLVVFSCQFGGSVSWDSTTSEDRMDADRGGPQCAVLFLIANIGLIVVLAALRKDCGLVVCENNRPLTLSCSAINPKAIQMPCSLTKKKALNLI